jgi:GYF domain 2
MAEQWIIRVEGKEYGPADLATLHEWKADGRVLPSNAARRVDLDLWKTAADIPSLFQIERPPVQREDREQRTEDRKQQDDQLSAITHQQSAISKPPARNVLTETFRIYFRGFFQFLALTLLTLVPSLCSQFAGAMIQTAPNVNVDLRTMVTAAFSVCMFVLTLVLWPVYVAGIQILSVELTAGRRAGFLSILNHAVKYWPRVAGLCIFVYVVFGLLTGFGLGVMLMMFSASISGSLFSVLVALGLAIFQIWLFTRFFINVLFWQQFAVLENASAVDALRASRSLARSGRDLSWYQRPLWRGALIVSVWYAFVIAIEIIAYSPKVAAEWPVIQDYYNQLMSAPDPQVILQKMMANVPQNPAINFTELGWSVLIRILQPLLGIAFVVLFLDSKGEDDS